MSPARWFPLLLLALLMACPDSPQAAPSAAVSAATARRYTDWFLGGFVDSLVARMSPELVARVRGREGLLAFQTNVTKALGDSVAIGEPASETREGRFVHRQTLHGRVTGTDAEIAWGLDSLGIVSLFTIRPMEEVVAPSKYLDYHSKTALRLPFEGTWTVFSGGRTRDQNHHAGARNQRFALDLAIMKEGTTHAGDGSSVEQYYCWGAEVLAPAAGTVVAAVGRLPDNPMGSTDRVNVAGNHVVLDHGNGEYSFLAHFQRGSLRVKVGDKVAVRQPLGRVGNSGNTTEPHLHYHLQDAPAFPNVECMPAAFHDYVADDLPVARGEPLKGQRVRNR